nr:protein PSY3-like isoform X1 [Malus domestica]
MIIRVNQREKKKDGIWRYSAVRMSLACLRCNFFFSEHRSILRARDLKRVADDEVVMAMEMEGRSLRVTTNDYDDPTANRGHDPSAFAPSRVRSGGGGGRKG